ncbi:armadillo-type protein [Mycena polygramma]|nr:armadillo-type protein [Mycena polygramma]
MFPQLRFNVGRQALWEGDPVPYAGVSVDEYESFATPVSAATSFLFSLASNRTKTMFMPILGFIDGVLRSNAPAPQPFGALNMTAALGPCIMRHPDLSGGMEQFVLQFACKVLGTFTKSGMKFSMLRSCTQNLNVHLRAISAALDDPEFPVRVQAALTLKEMVLVSDEVKATVSLQVSKVIQDLLKMSDEMDLDILNRSMEVMVEAFQTELMPVAAQLTARLESLVEDETELENQSLEVIMTGDDDKTYAATGVAKTIGMLPGDPGAGAGGYHPCYHVHVQAQNSRDAALSDNFVSYGSNIIKTLPGYQRMLLDIYTTAMLSEQLGENDRVDGCKLVESVLPNLRGSVDDALQSIIVTALSQLDKAETAALRLANLEVLINAVLYNPAVALHIMESTLARKFFDTWFFAINDHSKMPRVHDKKLSIMALCALLEMAPGAVPETLKDGWAEIVGGVLKIFKDLPGAIEGCTSMRAGGANTILLLRVLQLSGHTRRRPALPFALALCVAARCPGSNDLFPAAVNFLRARTELYTIALVGLTSAQAGLTRPCGACSFSSRASALTISYPHNLAAGLAAWFIPRNLRHSVLRSAQLRAGILPTLRSDFPARSGGCVPPMQTSASGGFW